MNSKKLLLKILWILVKVRVVTEFFEGIWGEMRSNMGRKNREDIIFGEMKRKNEEKIAKLA